MAEFEIDERVDITDVVCPVTFVKALLFSPQPNPVNTKGTGFEL